MKLREYQKRIADEGSIILNRYNLLYLAMEVRTGKDCHIIRSGKASERKECAVLNKEKSNHIQLKLITFHSATMSISICTQQMMNHFTKLTIQSNTI